ncbi:hypothetical protein AAG570_005815 [Ranatra chinensis]|uniref:Maelstrom domain-containing protein n=1 Tax=Ranatra chinensis TaxID=642074 RepID=A0ABD0Y138_9HEMI
MMEVKMKEEAKGHMFRGGLSEVATFASSMWNEMGSDERMPYNRMAMDMKRQRGDDLTKKFTSLGVSYATLDAEEREQEEALQEMTATVKNLVRSLPKDGGLKTRRFFVAHVNYFYKNSKDVYIPAEFAMASFSLQEGVVDHFHCFIDPNKSHLGFRFEANDWSQKTHSIPFGDSGWDRGVKSYYRLNGQVLQFIKNNNLEDDSIPPIFTMPDSLNNNTSISAVKSLFHELATSNDDVDEIPYRIYPLPQLFFELRNHCVDEAESTSYNQSLLKLPTVAMAENEIEKDLFTYAKNLGCSYHELKDLAVHCSQSIVFRWVFTICDNCCMHLGINLVLGRHCPHDADVDKFLDYETGNRRGDVAGAVSMPERGAAAAPMPGTSWSHNSPSSSPTSSESSSVWKVN